MGFAKNHTTLVEFWWFMKYQFYMTLKQEDGFYVFTPAHKSQ